MMKLANILKSRGNIAGQSLMQNNSAQNAFMGYASFSTVGHKASTGDRIFAALNLYKGKAALSAEPVAPTFNRTDNGDLFVKRSGYIMLSFTPSKGERKYDWERKQKFALTATEIGTLINLGPTGSCDFFHDPGLKTSTSGQVQKSLKITANSDGGGYFFTLGVTDKIKKISERLTVQVTPGEFSVIRTSFSFALPHIMGWDRYSNKLPSFQGGNSANLDKKQFNSEWDR